MEGTRLYKMIKRLNISLNEIWKKNIFFALEFTYYTDDTNQDSIKELNKSIQEAFYESILIL